MYCDHFKVEERWLILSTEPGMERCVVMQTLYQEFVKSTILKSKIERETYGGTKEVFAQWEKWIKSKINIKQKEFEQIG